MTRPLTLTGSFLRINGIQSLSPLPPSPLRPSAGPDCDVKEAQQKLKDDIDALKSDLSNLMDLLAALKDVVMPMAERLVHLENDANDVMKCCT